MNDKRGWILLVGILLLLAIATAAAVLVVRQTLQDTTQQFLNPFQDANRSLQTQVSEFLHPTPTIIPDPVTIIHDVRSLARLETIQYSVEKVITAELGSGIFRTLFGDRLLFVAHGSVIAGIDLNKLTAEDLWMDGSVLNVRLPAAEVFVATLDNDKSYVYDRDTGIFSGGGDANLETTARKAAEDEILKAALDDGILTQAQQNGENYLARLLRDLGYAEVRFITEGEQGTPAPLTTPTPGNTVAPPATITPAP